MTELVELMLPNYFNRDTCWAAISRTVKRLAKLNLIEDKEKNRFSFIKTTFKGRLTIQEKIPLELITDDRIKFLVNELKQRDIDQNKIKEIILELFSRYGRLTISDISEFLQMPSDLIKNLLEEMDDKLKKETIKVNKSDEIFYFINWKLLLSPIKKLLK